MIGRFVYMAGPPEGHIVLNMSWHGQMAEARVSPPDHVVEMMDDGQIGIRPDDEFMSLPIALSYAVLLASLSETALVVTGDRSVWPREWGELLEMQPYAVRLARSH